MGYLNLLYGKAASAWIRDDTNQPGSSSTTQRLVGQLPQTSHIFATDVKPERMGDQEFLVMTR